MSEAPDEPSPGTRPRRRPSRRSVILGASAVGTLVAVRWSDRDREEPPLSTASTAVTPLRSVTASGTEPRNPLVPTATDEAGGARVVSALFAGLVRHDATGALVHEVAESVRSEDATTWTVGIRPGQVFSDGSPVTPACFVDAWDHGALAGSATARLFEPIAGFDAVHADPPTASTMSGLRVVDEATFTITLTGPAADLPLRLGHPAFSPLPAGALDDLDAFGQDPVGNGPYVLAGRGAWQHDDRVDLVPNPRYAGGRTVANGGLTLTFHPSADAARDDLASGALDVLDVVPDARAPGAGPVPDGARAVEEPTAVLQLLTVPADLPGFTGEEGRYRRAAISRAVDRPAVVREVFGGARTPASDFTSPALAGWRPDLPGSEVLTFDADVARELWARAEAVAPYGGVFTIGYNTDGGHQGWVDAVAAQVTAVLGVPARGAAYPTLAALRTVVIDRTVAGAFRTGWQADYPGPDAFLSPLFATGADANDGDHSSAGLDALLARAAAAASVAEGEAFLRRAQGVLLAELPSIPLWCSHATAHVSPTVSGVRFGWDGVPAYEEIVPL